MALLVHKLYQTTGTFKTHPHAAMELHHRLRRDPTWDKSACNICGGMGHQAANCTNGTVNWRRLYGDDAFRLKAPVYPSDEDRAKKAKEVDYKGLEEKAKEWARTHASGALPSAAVPGAVAVKAMPVDNGVPAAAASAAAAAAPAPEAPLPEGWASAKDAQGRTYFWHKITKKVQWDRPTPQTPIS